MVPMLLLLLLPPGIEHRSLEGNWQGQGPFSIHILEIDPRHPAINIVPVHARDSVSGRETVLALANRYGAAAAINGGYFLYKPWDGAASGNQMINGRVLTSGKPRAALIFCREEKDVEHLAVATARFNGRLRSPRFDIPLDGVNRPHDGPGLVVYTSGLAPTTLSGNATEARIAGDGRLLDIVPGGNATIPEGGYVLSASGQPLPPIQPGDILELSLDLRQPVCSADDILGAGPALVRNGKLAIDEDGFAHAPVRHPRTAAGIKQNGNILFVTVDGRQAASIGMTIAELARLLLELGAVEAINLDGGGSTTMVLEGGIVNRPSDPVGPRPVSDAILVFSTPNPQSLQLLRERVATIPGAARILDEAARATAKGAQ